MSLGTQQEKQQNPVVLFIWPKAAKLVSFTALLQVIYKEASSVYWLLPKAALEEEQNKEFKYFE